MKLLVGTGEILRFTELPYEPKETNFANRR